MELEGKVVVVTGAESGIGQAIALECARAGGRVAAAGIDAAGLAGLTEAIAGIGAGPALAVGADIRDPGAVRGAFAAALERFGRIDAVVANAGVSGPRTDATELTLEDWQAVLAVNLTGTFNTVTEAARTLIAQGSGGSILATGSSTALRSIPGLAAYVASKAGVHGLMRTLALELGQHRIRVNTLVPGTTATPLLRSMPGHLEAITRALPLAEAVEPNELGRYAAFVLSDALPHLTGALLTLDSGRTIA